MKSESFCVFSEEKNSFIIYIEKSMVNLKQIY